MRGKVKSRDVNPVPLSSAARRAKAAQNFENFTGHAANKIEQFKIDPIKTGFVIGDLDAVEYTTIRDGKLEHYRHDFNDNSRPALISNYDGKKIGIFGGKYSFKNTGINDYG